MKPEHKTSSNLPVDLSLFDNEPISASVNDQSIFQCKVFLA